MLHTVQKLVNNLFELLFAVYPDFFQRRKFNIFHDGRTKISFHVNVKCVVFNDVWVFKWMNGKKILFQLHNMLFIHHRWFHSKYFPGLQLSTLIYETVGTLTNTSFDFVLIIKERSPLGTRRTYCVDVSFWLRWF